MGILLSGRLPDNIDSRGWVKLDSVWDDASALNLIAASISAILSTIWAAMSGRTAPAAVSPLCAFLLHLPMTFLLVVTTSPAETDSVSAFVSLFRGLIVFIKSIGILVTMTLVAFVAATAGAGVGVAAHDHVMAKLSRGHRR